MKHTFTLKVTVLLNDNDPNPAYGAQERLLDDLSYIRGLTHAEVTNAVDSNDVPLDNPV